MAKKIRSEVKGGESIVLELDTAIDENLTSIVNDEHKKIR